MKKLFDDTLKTNDKWNRQALTFFASFTMSVILGTTLTGLSFFLNIVTNPIAENVFNSFIMLTGVMSGTNIWNKIVDIKKSEKE